MEIKFQSETLRSLYRCADRQQVLEQTQEVRLPESMPDIGRVLGAWGKVLVRGKEWRSSGMNISGGVMTWVLYAPEDGSEPRSVEAWIPFQMKWDFPDTQKDGYIFVVPTLKGIDARSTSARKLMVRANICAWGRALVSGETDVYTADEVPEDVNLLTADYPMELACESGEKMVQVDEEINISDTYPVPEKILRYSFSPVVTEQRVMTSRLVFRGKGNLHMMYLSEGRVCSGDWEVVFSQYADLDRDYSSGATAQVVPVMTNLEADIAEGKLRMKCDLAAQYIIYDRVMVQLTEDAYSNQRGVTLQTCQPEIPRLLDRRQESLRLSQSVEASAGKIADVSCLCDLPQRLHSGDVPQLMLTGQMQVLYYDEAGNLQSGMSRFEQTLDVPADDDVQLDGILSCDCAPQAVMTAEQAEVSVTVGIEVAAMTNDRLPMVCGLELGELKEPDAMRPSLILRKFGGSRLWDMAKESGSTVAAILQANHIDGEPDTGRVLLIPVS